MKKIIKLSKSLCLLLVALIVINSLLSVNVFAAESKTGYDKYGFTEITLLEDSKTLICGNNTYYCFKFEPPHRYSLDPINTYHYANEVVREDGGSRATAYASKKGANTMWIENAYGEIYYFATKDENDYIGNQFLNENFATRRLWTSDNTYANVSAQFAYRLQSLYETQATTSIPVKLLGSSEKYRLAGYDRTDTFAYELGYIYKVRGEFIYVAHSKLSDDYFDSDGNFIYIGTGSVDGVTLTGSALKSVKELIASAKPAEFSDTYEYDEYSLNDNYDISFEKGITIVFWVVYFLFGIVAPIPVFIIGIALGRKRKNEHPKYWYSLSFTAAAWLFISLVLLAILLVI